MPDGRSEMADFVFLSKYSKTVNGRKETWDESVDRVIDMFMSAVKQRVGNNKQAFDSIKQYVDSATVLYRNREVLAAQRALQFAGHQIVKTNAKIFNCSSSPVDRVDFFKEATWLLLCGCGVGYSIYQSNIDKLPIVTGTLPTAEQFIIADSIEGWSEALHQLMVSHFYGLPKPAFNYNLIRPRGSLVANSFLAPGSEPLQQALQKIDEILIDAKGRKLRTFEAHRIICVLADMVRAGGSRRSALLALFDVDDDEMLTCKTGDWFIKYPELAMANNSAAILPDVSRDKYDAIFESTKVLGEPGIIFINHKKYLLNPCAEIGMYPYIEIDGQLKSGWSFCNLTEIVGSGVDSLETFIKRATAATVFGTLQNLFCDFSYLGDVTNKIFERDNLIGVGITGIAESPDILLNPEYQKIVAEHVKSVNADLCKLLNMNSAARCTTVKPSGTASIIVKTSPGIHPFHAQKYIRNIQVTDIEEVGTLYGLYNPDAVEKSVYGGNVVSFPITIPDNAIFAEDLSAIDFLDNVKLTQQNWIEYGTNFDHPSHIENPDLRHNVSNTCKVASNEWSAVQEYIWENKEYFCGISMLPATGDLDYPQAPFISVLDEHELVAEYGAAAILSSGLVVDALKVFDNIWLACDTALNKGESLVLTTDMIADSFKAGLTKDSGKYAFSASVDGLLVTDANAVIQLLQDKLNQKIDWVRRFKKFARNYYRNDTHKTANCLKHVHMFHKWQKISKINKIDWSLVEWNDMTAKMAGDDLAASCSGGKCEVRSI
jgi:ribonucleoside-diphosphate reductase alpha chain